MYLKFSNIIFLLSYVIELVSGTAYLTVKTPDLIDGKKTTVRCMLRYPKKINSMKWVVEDYKGFPLKQNFKVIKASSTLYIMMAELIFYPSVDMNIQPQPKYLCTAMIDGTQHKVPLVMDVYTIPSAPTITTSRMVKANIPIEFQCFSDASNPPAALYWTFDGKKYKGRLVEKTPQDDNTVVVENTVTLKLEPDDDGKMLKCLLEHDTLTEPKVSSIQLVVHYAPIVTVPIDSYTVIMGKSVTLQCTVNSRPEATVSWKKNGETLDLKDEHYQNGQTHEKPSLVIHNLKRVDTGSYQCVAENALDEVSSTDIKLSVVYIPLVKILTSSYEVMSSKEVTMRCYVMSEPPAEIHWMKNGKQIYENADYYIYGGTNTSPELIIKKARYFDAGVYQCVAENLVGTKKSPNITLTVTYAPIVNSPKHSFTIEEEKPLTLQCGVRAYPAATIIWVKDAKNISTKSDHYKNGNAMEPSLTIKSIDASDAGTYLCTAENAYGAGKGSEISIEVLYIPQLHVTPEYKSVREDEKVTLTCSGEGNPPITRLRWVKINGEKTTTLIAYDATDLKIPSKFTIESMKQSDIADYACEAVNDQGPGLSNSVYVVIRFAPSLTLTDVSYTFTEQTNSSVDIEVKAAPHVDDIVWTKDGEKVDTEGGHYRVINRFANISLLIIDVQKEDAGTYVCTVTNSEGKATSDKIKVTVHYTAKIVVKPEKVEEDENKNVNLSCSFEALPPVTDIKWLHRSENKTKLLQVRGRFSGGTFKDPTLRILSLKPEDEGYFICQGLNEVGFGAGEMKMIVRYAPILIEPVITVYALPYQPYLLVCNVKANPKPTLYTWKYTEDKLGEKTGTLEIVPLRSKLGYGVYYCQAENSLGKSDVLEIHVKAANYTERGYDIPRPYFLYTNLDADVGKNVRLNCTTRSMDESYRLVWYRGKRVLPSNKTILNVLFKTEDEMKEIYMCVVKTRLGVSDVIKFGFSKRKAVMLARLEMKKSASNVLLYLLIIFTIICCCVYLYYAKRKDKRRKIKHIKMSN